GLIIGRRAHILTMGPIGVAAATAPNAKEGLMAMETFLHLHATYSQVNLRATPSGVRIDISFHDQVPQTERFHTESLFFMVQHYIEMVTGQPLNNARFNARHSKPSYHHVYSQWIHSPITFDNDSISIDIPKEHLLKHSPFYNPATWKQTLQTLSQRVRELGKSNSHSYSQYVLSLLYSYEPPLPAVSFAAERLHISERTLNRRLQKENTNFRELKSQVMQFWAEQYLQDTELSVEAIANLLGYQDTANFRRAFRNQKHCSPQEYRKRFSDLARANTLG
ncbi:MAG: helix-turn-helix domain-containing protein, partial [Pseudomonadota bacterium]|nr:helix-turn-helix domain-containing protein [Pseudomonadota bacterium]